ncbi:hypothetical protein WN51_01516 [Melipona quadrifasciata]|uniref:Replication protein A 14 kDa subunit n=1 Tax=Melipona quadrifasciata TaxID=166423 RepID=A0A0M8ZWL6_9HYME|nr:hypothetical protein WN51_01516 [Melipona quadrifasciata]
MIKKRIDGRRLGQNIGNQVILLGTIGKKSSNGRNLELRTTDGVQVNVTLPEPIDSEAEGYIEVHGTLQSSTTMYCSNYVLTYSCIVRQQKARKVFITDTDQYNQLLIILNVLGPGKWKMTEDSEGF